MQTKYYKDLSRKVSNRVGCSVLKSLIVFEGHKKQLRKMDSITAIAKLTMEIPLIAKEYGARFDLPVNIVQESIRLIIKKFGGLGLMEIREAYREYAAGELKIQGAEMYGGEFNVSSLGKILTGYTQRRNKILIEILKEKEKYETEQNLKAIHEKKQNDFNLNFPKEILKQKKQIKNWNEVPSHWYKLILDRNWIYFKHGEAIEIYKEAEKLAKIELSKINISISIKERFKRSAKNESDLIKSIARRLTIYKKVVQIENWKPESKI